MKHDTEVKILCKRKHINLGVKLAHCRDGDLKIESEGTPDCTKTGEFRQQNFELVVARLVKHAVYG